jgi:hypothetical protein
MGRSSLTMQGFSAKVVSQTAVSRLSGHYDKLPRGHAALMHSEFTALAKKNARSCGSSADMPLGFRSKDLPSAPIQPLEGPCATPRNSTTKPVVHSTSTSIEPSPKSPTKELVPTAMSDTSMPTTLSDSTKKPVVRAMLVVTVPTILPSNSTKEPVVRAILEPSAPTLDNSTTEPVVGDMLVATALSMAVPSNSISEPVVEVTPVMTKPEPVIESGVMPLPATKLPPIDTRNSPAGLKELPLDALTRQGMTHGPSVKETQDPASTEDELAMIAMTPVLIEEVAPLATHVVTRETNVGKLYDAQKPQLAATLSKLPGNYHSDRTVGFHQSPRIDNLGPLPAMMINSRVVNNLVLD